MNDMSSMNRERKKKELKRQVISTGGGNAAVKEEAASREERPVKRKRRRILWILLLLAVAGGLGYGAYFYMNERVYTQFVAVWEIPVEIRRSASTGITRWWRISRATASTYVT